MLLGDITGVEKAFSKNGPFLFTARAVAFGMRFGGPDMVRTLLDAGASLDYTLTPELALPFDCRWGHTWGRQLDFSKFMFPKANSLDEEAAKISGSKKLAPISEEDRLAVMQLLNERNIDGLHNFYYYSILYDDPAVTEYLRSVGIDVLPSPVLDFMTGKIRVNEIKSIVLDPAEDEIRKQLSSADGPALSRIINGLYDTMHAKIPIFRYHLLSTREAVSSAAFPTILEKTDLVSKLSRWDTVRMLIALKNVSGIDYVLQTPWARSTADREFLLQLAREDKDPSPEIVSLVLKSLDEESGSDSILDALSLEPKATKTTDLKKIWSTRKLTNGTYEIFSYKGTDTQVTVPDRIGGIEVTSIAPTTFQIRGNGVNARISSLRKNITSIEIPGAIKTIPNELLAGNRGPKLETVILNNGTTHIGKKAFQGCESLVEITLPEGLRSIESGAFEDCKSLKHVEFGKELRNIKAEAFKGTGLEAVKLPENVREVGKEAFADCPALHSVDAPKRLKLSAGAFTGCPKLADANGCIVINRTLFGYKDPQSVGSLMPDQYPPLEIGREIITVSRPFTSFPTIMYRPSKADGQVINVSKLRGGDRVLFGRFPQDTSVALKPIAWRVGKITDDGYAMLITEKALVFLPDLPAGPAWKDSRPYKFLNGPFMDIAFSELETDQMGGMRFLYETYDPYTGQTTPTYDDNDVFLPRYDLVREMYPNLKDCRATPTEYAFEQMPEDERSRWDLHSQHDYVSWALMNPNGINEYIAGGWRQPQSYYAAWTIGQFLRPMIVLRP